MRHGKILIGLLTAVLAAAAVLLWRLEPALQVQTAPEVNIPLSASVTTDGRTEEISLWQNAEGNFCLFLPGYAEPEQTVFRVKSGAEVSLDQKPLEDGSSCGSFQTDTPYVLRYSGKDGSGQATLTIVRSGNVPTMHIEVQSGNMDYIHAVKGNEESGRIRIYRTDGSAAYSGNLKTISGRGNFTWTQDKKPYSLELTAEADLLGMGQAKEWILFSNPADPSHLRNKLVFDYAQAAGLSYSPDSQWVDLYLNGEYAGLYLLSERNEIHPQRVDLEENNSFLVSMELDWRLEDQGYPFIRTNNGTALRIHHSSVTEGDLLARWISAENAILADDGIDSVTGKAWTELIDVDSWVKKYLIEEIFGSVDACALSQYFYGDGEDGKIYAGPVWDYDMAMGNSEAWQLSQPEAFFGNRAILRAWQTEPWFAALYEKTEFYSQVTEQYKTVFQPLLAEFLNEKLAAYASQIQPAAFMNQHRWPGQDASAETESIRDYMTRRMEFLSKVWLEGERYCTLLVDTNDGSNTACYAVRPGEYAPELVSYEYIPDAVGWYHRDTEQPFDITQPIYEDTDIYLKYTDEAEEEKQQTSRLRSVLSTVPLTVLLVLLTGAFLLDRSRIRKKTENEQKPKVPHN